MLSFACPRSSEVIDATQKACRGRFINHSCDPNCETQKWMVRGELCVVIVTIVDVAQGAELTYNYDLDWNSDKRVK